MKKTNYQKELEVWLEEQKVRKKDCAQQISHSRAVMMNLKKQINLNERQIVLIDLGIKDAEKDLAGMRRLKKR